jgi:hypothetical protein
MMVGEYRADGARANINSSSALIGLSDGLTLNFCLRFFDAYWEMDMIVFACLQD